LWNKSSDFEKKVIDDKAIERRIRCDYIDIPDVYHYTDKNFQEYFDALAGSDNFGFFTLKPIQKMIEFNYPLVKEFIIKRLFIPYIFFQITFVTYNNGFWESFYTLQKIKADDDAYNSLADKETFDSDYTQKFIINVIYCSLLVLFSCYFLTNELRQLWGDRLNYFTNFWNYIDILPPTLICFSMFISFTSAGSNEQMERSLMAVTTFFMWFKLLYFLRIFKDTGYLIRMISTVIVDMRHFFLVLFIAITAFGDSFLCIAMGNPELDDKGEPNAARFTNGFINSIIYTYTVILGGFDVATYEDSAAYVLVMVLFLLCTVFNMIVMLNLLIAIISESFAAVNSNAKNAQFQEMASLISENNYLIPDSKKASYAQEGLKLLVITDLEAKEDVNDPTQAALKEMKEELGEKIEAVQTSMEERSKEYHEIQKEEIKEIKKIIDGINELLQDKFGPKYDKYGDEIEEEDEKKAEDDKPKAEDE
jgi:hypothetical protein